MRLLFERVCLIHYHEIGLKGRNRSAFERRLMENIAFALSGLPACAPVRISGHLMVALEDEAALDDVARVLLQVPGIARVSRAWRTDRDPESYCKAAEMALADCGEFSTFKVAARRSNTDYPIDSMQLNRLVGAHLCAFAPEAKVQMKDPDVKVRVEVVQGSVYVYSKSDPAVGGLPVGSAGKVVSLLSGGFDSPVASWTMMKRGAVVVGAHFSGRPQTSDSSEWQVDELAADLAPAAGLARVYYIALGDVQRAIAASAPEGLRVLLYRRMMFRVAQEIARREDAKALVTGESLGQVASQTLDNIAVTDAVADMPVLRPLVGTDKQDIIDMARRIGTYETSARQADDCCTLFMPRRPATHARLADALAAEQDLPIGQWTRELVDAAEYRDYPCPAYKPPAREFARPWHGA